MKKPDTCAACPYSKTGFGFVPDDPGQNPLIAIQLEAPGEEEALRGIPLCGRSGRFWVDYLIAPLGLKREDVLISNTIRCRPPNNKYPTGDLRRDAEAFCRQYDAALAAFAPDLFVVTLHPSALLRQKAYTRLVIRDLSVAVEKAREGFRPLVLMGETAMNLRAPWLGQGVTKWRGHWWLGDLQSAARAPRRADAANPNESGALAFAEASQ